LSALDYGAAAHYSSKIVQAYKMGWSIVEAHDKEHIEEAVIAKMSETVYQSPAQSRP
jgi:hypothetical protein